MTVIGVLGMAHAGFVFFAVVATFDAVLVPIIPLYIIYHLYEQLKSVATNYIYKHIAAAAIAYYAFGVALMILTAIVKRIMRLLMGPRRSSHANDILLNWTYPRFAVLTSGSAGLNVYLRLLGAQIGSMCTCKLWLIKLYSDPSDMKLGVGCMVMPSARTGTFNTETTRRVTSSSAKVADIELGRNVAETPDGASTNGKDTSVITVGAQSLVGVMAYVGSGATVERDATLAPFSYVSGYKAGKQSNNVLPLASL